MMATDRGLRWCSEDSEHPFTNTQRSQPSPWLRTATTSSTFYLSILGHQLFETVITGPSAVAFQASGAGCIPEL